MYGPAASAKHGRCLVLAGGLFLVFFSPDKTSSPPSGGRDLGLGLEPWWEDRRGWEKPGDMVSVPSRIRSTALGLGGAAGIRGQCVPLP